ncbi:hypothetical protein SAMN05660199_03903 [Klenkia soli]|uniref:Uncharacterized protein n=1 Tax=Klenkia soli TaxID=1052260 RepID=A0A1H0SMJ7_9ACTN|nr:hypothetical protein [Klenkia soli]SDP42947.1 hypothetical protein SAMN05660199_03903 [Klenkia soli]
MRTSRLVAPVAVLALAGCTSFTEDAAAPSSTGSGPTTAATSTTGGASAEDLAVVDEVDLATSAGQVTAARVVADADGYAVLLIGSPSSTVTTPTSVTGLTGGVPTDVALVDGEPLAVVLSADPVSTDPVLGLVPVAGTTAGPLALDPQQSAPRGLAVLAAAGADVVHLLAEDPDDAAARVLSVDPASGEVQAAADVDPGADDVTSLDLVGLVVTADGDLVAGLDLLTSDGRTSGRLVTLDDQLEPTADPTEVEGRLLGLTTDDAGAVQPLVADPDGGVRLGDQPVGGDELGTRVAGVAAADGTVVTAFLDQDSPTVTVTGDDDPRTVALCDGEGDALSVASAGDGTFLVAGTCDGEARLWTLG